MTDDNAMLIPLIPEVADLEPAHGDVQMAVFRERRELALREVRQLTGISQLALTLQPDAVYRLVIPTGTVLQQGKDGLYSGVLYADGKISQHARFETLPPDLARIASALGTQILLVSIAVQLNRVERSIASLSEELHDDRLGRILGAARLYEGALHMAAGAKRDAQLLNAVQSLTVGFDQLLLELRKQIQALPDTSNMLWDNWGPRSKADSAADKLRLAEATLGAAVHGVSLMSECYAALDEPQAGAVVIKRCLADIESCGIEAAAEKARLVEVREGNCHPESPWLQFSEARTVFTRAALSTPLCAEDLEQGSVIIEFQARDLMGER